MMPADDEGGLVARLLRETERTAIRTRNGLRYLSGAEWAPISPTPADVVWEQGPASLRRFRSEHVRYAVPVVMFLGLVSRSYVLDLHRQSSLARYLLESGFDVYLLDWGVPTAADSANTLETYTHRYLPRALQQVLARSAAEEALLLGYCMGGNLALLALATQQLPVRGLVTMATPVDFDALTGLAGVARDLAPDTLVDWTGNVPADYMASFFRVRKPTADLPATARLWENLWDEQYVESHQAMARWAREHVPFPGAAFRQVHEQWLGRNGFVSGELWLAGDPVDLEQVQLPMLSYLATRDDLVQLESARPIGDIVGSSDFTLREVDAGHAGLAVSRQAAKTTLPALSDWLADHNRPRKD